MTMTLRVITLIAGLVISSHPVKAFEFIEGAHKFDNVLFWPLSEISKKIRMDIEGFKVWTDGDRTSKKRKCVFLNFSTDCREDGDYLHYLRLYPATPSYYRLSRAPQSLPELTDERFSSWISTLRADLRRSLAATPSYVRSTNDYVDMRFFDFHSVPRADDVLTLWNSLADVAPPESCDKDCGMVARVFHSRDRKTHSLQACRAKRTRLGFVPFNCNPVFVQYDNSRALLAHDGYMFQCSECAFIPDRLGRDSTVVASILSASADVQAVCASAGDEDNTLLISNLLKRLGNDPYRMATTDLNEAFAGRLGMVAFKLDRADISAFLGSTVREIVTVFLLGEADEQAKRVKLRLGVTVLAATGNPPNISAYPPADDTQRGIWLREIKRAILADTKCRLTG